MKWMGWMEVRGNWGNLIWGIGGDVEADGNGSVEQRRFHSVDLARLLITYHSCTSLIVGVGTSVDSSPAITRIAPLTI